MTKPLIAVTAAVGVWAVLLPALVARDQTGGFVPPWRPVPLVAAGAALVAVGAVLVWSACSRLVAAGVKPFAIHPGPVLVTDGIYGQVRNPMDLGNTLAAVGAALAVDLSLAWMAPLAAFLYYAAGQAPLENRFLQAVFGDEFADYRARVPAWTPLWS